MKSIWLGTSIIFCCLISIIPAHAQEQECLEIWNLWSDRTRHEVNLQTGEVTTYDGESVIGSAAEISVRRQHSPDRRYNHKYESLPNDTRRLTLTDNRTGITVVLSENVRGVAYWSEDSQWLAYSEKNEPQALILTVLHVETAAFLSVKITDSTEAYLLGFVWSSDASQIALSYEPSPGAPIQLAIYAVPGLVLRQRYKAAWSLTTLVWSPSGRYLGITGTSLEAGIIDTTTQQFHTVTLDGFSNFHPQWSPDETYLVVSFTESDFYDTYNFIDTQGTVVLEDVFAMQPIDWVNEHEIIVQRWTVTGLPELALIDLQADEPRLILPNVNHYALSADRRYFAAWRINIQTFSELPESIQIFDLTQTRPTPVFRLSTDAAYQNFIWHQHDLELIVFFDDRSLRGYHYETGAWRMITTVLGDEWNMQPITCVYS